MSSSNKTRREEVYRSLKAMILTGELSTGAHLTEIETANRLNVSRTPVREALNRLERDGLVQGRPRQGYLVRGFDATMFDESFEIRELLDGLAAERAAETATGSDKQRLLHILDQCDRLAEQSDRGSAEMLQELQLGTDLHRIIAEISGNRMLLEFIGGILDKSQFYVWTELLWFDDWTVMRRQHREIVTAICDGDRQLSGELAREHVRSARKDMVRMMSAKSEVRRHVGAARFEN
jgi:DNA-binding GntR family transcriptional regulator